MGKLLKADGRGRILLPKEHRHFEHFEITEESGKLVLTPMRFEPISRRKKKNWNNSEVKRFLHQQLLPPIVEDIVAHPNVPALAIILNREELLDDDRRGELCLGLIVSHAPSSDFLSDEEAKITKKYAHLFKKLTDHGVHLKLKLKYLLDSPEKEQINEEYEDIAYEGNLLWEATELWQKWKRRVLE